MPWEKSLWRGAIVAAALAAGACWYHASDMAHRRLVTVFVTVPSMDVGKALSRSLVQKKLAACVNLTGGIHSTYEWEGKLNEDAEHMMIIKTRRSLLAKMTRTVEEEHPYDTPEVIAMDIVGGSAADMDFVVANTREL